MLHWTCPTTTIVRATMLGAPPRRQVGSVTVRAHSLARPLRPGSVSLDEMELSAAVGVGRLRRPGKRIGESIRTLTKYVAQG